MSLSLENCDSIDEVKMSLTACVRREPDRFEKLDSALFVFALKQSDAAVHLFRVAVYDHWTLGNEYRKVINRRVYVKI